MHPEHHAHEPVIRRRVPQSGSWCADAVDGERARRTAPAHRLAGIAQMAASRTGAPVASRTIPGIVPDGSHVVRGGVGHARPKVSIAIDATVSCPTRAVRGEPSISRSWQLEKHESVRQRGSGASM
jgi:hypothetical protein